MNAIKHTYALDLDGSRRRLEMLESHVDPLTERRLQRVGLARGWKCLEVGGGLGSVARRLADTVGADGRVTVTDLDTRYLDELVLRRPRNIDVWRHDVMVDPLPQGEYDLVHARWLLYHLADPLTACRRLIRTLRPGGVIVIEDVDFFPLSAAPSRPFAETMRAIAAAVGEPVGHGGCWAAQTLPVLFDRQPIEDLTLDVHVDILRGRTPMAEFWRMTGAQMRAKVERMGMVAMASYDEVLEALADPAFWSISTAHVAISARRRDR